MNARMTRITITIVAFACVAYGRNVDLSTVPPRDEVQLTIYNSEDLTLVREFRSLTLKKGLNRIQYAWANTLIDPTSVEIRPLEREDDIEILDTTFLHDKPCHCIWNIESKFEGQVRFQVTYFTSGISWAADYVATSNPEETKLAFDGFVRLTNHSGEEYENAEIRLVVGVVNLVEKIQDLARRGIITPPKPTGPMPAQYKRKAMDAVIARAEQAKAGASRPPEIVKEGLSEYFIYTVEGRWTVPNRWSKRLVSFEARDVAFDILYRMRAHQYGPRPIRFFLFKNDKEHKLGTTPLPDGIVRTFRDNGRDGLSYMGQTKINYVPIKEDIELNVGTDDEVVHKRTCMEVKRSNFAFDSHNRVCGWDETRFWKEEICNFKGKPIRMEIRHVIPGHVDVEAEPAKLHDYHTLEFTHDVKARKVLAFSYTTTHHLGTNARQNRLTLK